MVSLTQKNLLLGTQHDFACPIHKNLLLRTQHDFACPIHKNFGHYITYTSTPLPLISGTLTPPPHFRYPHPPPPSLPPPTPL